MWEVVFSDSDEDEGLLKDSKKQEESVKTESKVSVRERWSLMEVYSLHLFPVYRQWNNSWPVINQEITRFSSSCFSQWNS